MKSGKFAFVFLLASTTLTCAQEQSPGGTGDHESYYLFPVHRGQPASLAGTMGELRSTHLHSGIDIRTYNQIGWPVVAAADGYVSRILVSPVGYGNGLYLTHPNGTMTLYGHLDHFNNAIQQYATDERYRLKESSVNLFPSSKLFPVKKGDTIAFSGNSGSSGGPHVHFEIRDSKNQALNPQRYGFSEIVDHLPPVADKVALKTLDLHSRINDQFGRFEFYAKKTGNNYTLPSPILAWGKIGIELLAHDQLDNSIGYRCGFNQVEVKVDSVTVLKELIDKIDFNETRTIMTMLDFRTLESTGSRFEKLFVDDGNTLSYYKVAANNGVITIDGDHDVHVDIIMTDSHDNTSHVRFTLQPDQPGNEVIETTAKSIPPDWDVVDNTLIVHTPICANDLHKVWSYVQGDRIESTPDYQSDERETYLFDLRKGLPDSIVTCGGVIKPTLNVTIYPGTEYTYYDPSAQIRFPANALFDTLYFGMNHEVLADSSETFAIGNPDVPLRHSYTGTLQPTTSPAEPVNQVGLYEKTGRYYQFVSNDWHDGKINFSASDFGTFTFLRDSTPPRIVPVFIDPISSRFTISDNLSGIASYRATLNGDWLLLNYDQKSGAIWTVRKNDKVPMQGPLVVTVTDNAGNVREFKTTLK